MTKIKIYNLEKYLELSNTEFKKYIRENIATRLFEHDHTLWSNDPAEISNRLGWLDSPEYMFQQVDDINSFVDECKSAGFKKVLLLGMGGSSLAPELFNEIFYEPGKGLELRIADSTHPDKVRELKEYFDPPDTLYIVSTKSGSTVETISQMNYFYNYCRDAVGNNKAGSHFVAITDPGSKLEDISSEHEFRECFLNDPNIGGRFSVLSYFGLVPAALAGVNIKKLISKSIDLKTVIQSGEIDLYLNPLWLGILIGLLANDNKDKLVFNISDKIINFGDWLEQLIAESSGKKAKGILPVLESNANNIEPLSNDRVFVCISLNNDPDILNKTETIRGNGLPLFNFELDDKYDLGAEFYRWEIITAIACKVLGVNPFDQPNVESAKAVAREFLKEYNEKGNITEPKYYSINNRIKVVADFNEDNLPRAISAFIMNNLQTDHLNNNRYLSIHAYIPQNFKTVLLLGKIKREIQRKISGAITIGFGPRFLHSTGQLHKGDSGNGIFLQIVSEPADDMDIPDSATDSRSSISFGTLIKAQYLGDRTALLEANRKVMTVDIGKDVENGLTEILDFIQNT